MEVLFVNRIVASFNYLDHISYAHINSSINYLISIFINAFTLVEFI